VSAISELLLQASQPIRGDGILAVLCAGCMLYLCTPVRSVGRVLSRALDSGSIERTFYLFRGLPVIRQVVRSSKRKILFELDKSMKKEALSTDKIRELPNNGFKASDILAEAAARKASDYSQPFQSSKMTGTIYATDETHRQICNEIYCDFAHTNPLHSDAFPSVARMENEIVSMAASFLGGNSNHEICGTVTSGGTESILTALRASRDFICYLKGVENPEM